ncbi:MAG: hypothetical protein EBR02_00340 [Alphaproteobacteria bacterium]|nr:hypothetical protein [Alphaproteobacteria bacterium]
MADEQKNTVTPATNTEATAAITALAKKREAEEKERAKATPAPLVTINPIAQQTMKAQGLYEAHVHGRYKEQATKMAETASKWTWGKGGEQIISEDTAKSTIPLVAGALVAGAGMLLFEPINKATKFVFNLPKKLIEGTGLNKIPLIGGALQWIADGISTIGEYAAYGVVALAGFIGYSMFDASKAAPLPESAKTGMGGTSVTPTAAPTTTVTVTDPKGNELTRAEKVPTGVAAVTPLAPNQAEIVAALGLTGASVSAAAAARQEAINKKLSDVDGALKEYIKNQQQSYANGRDFAEKAEEFTKTNRQPLVDALVKLGLSPTTAQAFVPVPPKVRPTINEDGTDFPPELVNFAKKFEETYLEAYPKILHKEGNSEVPLFKMKRWDQLNFSEREEFLAKAVSFTETRFDELKKQIPVEHSGYTTGAHGVAGYTTSQSYYNYKIPPSSWWDRTFSSEKSWEDRKSPYLDDLRKEHQFYLNTYDMNPHSSSVTTNGQTIEITSLPKEGNIKALLTQWQQNKKMADEHRKTMQESVPMMDQFGEQVKQMQQQLAKIKDGSLVVQEGKLVEPPKKEVEAAPVKPAPTKPTAANTLLQETQTNVLEPVMPSTPKQLPNGLDPRYV